MLFAALTWNVSDIALLLLVVAVGYGLYAGVLSIAKKLVPTAFTDPKIDEILREISIMNGRVDKIKNSSDALSSLSKSITDIHRNIGNEQFREQFFSVSRIITDSANQQRTETVQRMVENLHTVLGAVKASSDILVKQHERPAGGKTEPWFCQHTLCEMKPQDQEIFAGISQLLIEVKKVLDACKQLDSKHTDWQQLVGEMNKFMQQLLNKLSA